MDDDAFPDMRRDHIPLIRMAEVSRFVRVARHEGGGAPVTCFASTRPGFLDIAVADQAGAVIDEMSFPEADLGIMPESVIERLSGMVRVVRSKAPARAASARARASGRRPERPAPVRGRPALRLLAGGA